ncbi:MAG: hypothetical protein ACRC5H_03065, partial [Treponemataceae bacterium]
MLIKKFLLSFSILQGILLLSSCAQFFQAFTTPFGSSERLDLYENMTSEELIAELRTVEGQRIEAR